MQSDESGSTALPGGPWGRGAAAAPCTLPGAGSFPAHIPPEPCRAAGWGWIADLWDGSVPEAASTHCTRAVLRAAGPGSRQKLCLPAGGRGCCGACRCARSSSLASIWVHAGCKRSKGRKPTPPAWSWALGRGVGMPFPNCTLRYWQCCRRKAELWLS